MTDLITRLESAQAGSRELDAEIARAVGWKQDKFAPAFWYPAEDVEKARRTKKGIVRDRAQNLPYWSESVDTAMTLLPEGWWLQIRAYGAWYHVDGMFDEDTARRPLRDDEVEFDGNLAKNCPTLPLALCIAALRARMGG